MFDKYLPTSRYRKIVGVEILLCILFSWIPFIACFGALGLISESLGSIPLKSLMNYFSLLACGYLFLAVKGRISWRLFFIGVFAVLLAVMNFILAPYASSKWFLNWVGFVFIGVVIATAIQRMSRASLRSLEKKLSHSFLFVTLLLLLLFLFVYLQGFSKVIAHVFSKNENLWVATNVIGIDKQALGMMLGLTVIWYALSWRQLTDRHKIFVAATLIILFPFWIYIRTLLLALLLVSVWRTLFKHSLLRIVLVANLLLLSPLFFMYWSDVYKLLESSYDRLPSLLFSLDTLTSTFWGLGNGGYHVYVEAVNYALMGAYGGESMLRNEWFWVAPESDVVYFIASWGGLSIFFFLALGYILIKGGGALRKFSWQMGRVELFMLYSAWFVIFSGISQDNVTSLVWWAMISAGYGTVIRGNPYKQEKSSALFDT